MPGICTSRSMTSTGFDCTARSASSPDATVIGRMPAERTIASIVCRMLPSSSAIRTVAARAICSEVYPDSEGTDTRRAGARMRAASRTPRSSARTTVKRSGCSKAVLNRQMKCTQASPPAR